MSKQLTIAEAFAKVDKVRSENPEILDIINTIINHFDQEMARLSDNLFKLQTKIERLELGQKVH